MVEHNYVGYIRNFDGIWSVTATKSEYIFINLLSVVLVIKA